MKFITPKTNKRILLIPLIVLSLLIISTSTALAVTGSSSVWDSTCYWEGQFCIGQSFRVTANAGGSSARIDSNTWVVYTTNFGGVVIPGPSVCGYSSWLKQSTSWIDQSGSHSISGWTDIGALCSPSESCDAFLTDQDHTLHPDPLHGDFYYSAAWGTDCLPAGSLYWYSLTAYP